MDNEKREAVDRMKICLECDEFRKLTKQCKICNCFMPVKVRLPGQSCPLDKW